MKQKLSYLLFLLIGLFWQTNIGAQTMQAGDIAFIGLNIDGNDTFSFIALTDLPAGETLFFSDEGWGSDDTWAVAGEGHISWTIPAGVTTGTIVTIERLGVNSYSASSGGTIAESDTTFALSIAGDQVLAYQSAGNTVRAASPTFIAAIHMDYNSTNYDTQTHWSQSVSGGTSESTVPTGLTNGVNAVSVINSLPEYDNTKYNGTLTGTAEEVRTAINNSSNWVFDNDTPYNISASGYPTPNITAGCTMTATITSQTNIACNGGATGSLTVTTSGGTANYTYIWTRNGSNFAGTLGTSSTTNTLSGINAATYEVTVTDDNGCTDTASTVITEPASGITLTQNSQTNIACNGGNTGAASVNPATGGAGGYTYNWTPGNPAGDGTTSVTGLSAGTWTCTATDSNGCSKSVSFTITEPTALSANGVATNVSCNGGTNGTIDLTVTGGTGPYTYLWSNSFTTEDLSGLEAGTYSVTVTDANDCTTTETVDVEEPAILSASAVATNVSCNGGSNGAVDLTVTGGNPPYTYAWNNTAITEDLSGLTAATYSVTVTDSKGCTATETVDVFEPIILSASAVATNVSCNGGSNGAVDLTVIGGNPPYTYAWNNTATTEDLSGLTAATYSVTVTDSKGCTATESVTVNGPSPITANGVATNVSCNGGSNGTIDLTVSGGTPPYTFVWSNTATTEDLTGLAAGTYEVTVTDDNGCTATESVEVTEPAVLSASAVATNISCNGGNNGAVDLTVTGGTAPYTYAWNNTATTEDITGLTAATYSVTVTDSKGCTATSSITITEPAILTASAIATDVSCSGTSDGEIDLTVTGGTAPYTFDWSNTATTEDLMGIPTGTYTVTITDANNCTATASATLINGDNIAPVADVTNLPNITMECEVLASDVNIPTATDNCGGTVTVTNDASFPISTQGTTVITWTYEDENGNTSTQTQNVIIDDVSAPVTDQATLTDVTMECEVLASDLTIPTATDNCGGTVTVTNDASFPISTQGTTVITWTYEDENGNTS
ncbi:beta strand repeat-containing protein, partial [Mesonia aestuariivivens]